MLALFPEGFEEAATSAGVELVAYTDATGEERLRGAFGAAEAEALSDGWEDAWKRFHRPIRVGPLWVGPPWEQPDADAIAVVIDPGRAFGTGAHPTTRLCLGALPTLERGSLVDLGCGSGVLAIAAAKLGFAPVYAVDAESDAVQATRRNAVANGVALEIARADALADPIPTAEVAIANVTLDAVERIATRVSARRLLLSGYLATQRPDVAWQHVARFEAGGWAADAFRRR
jgi:ribosomal protein L11 methyltransferase